MEVSREPNTGTPHLLLVDDEPIIVATIASALARAGFEVTAAMTTDEAIAHVRKNGFALAILDYAMPGRNGLETATVFAALGQPFMFLSAYRDERLVEQAVEAGALAYVLKPIDPVQLIPVVRAATRRASEIAALRADRDRLATEVGTDGDVGVAVGLLMARRGLSRQRADEALHLHASRTGRTVAELAREIVTGAGPGGLMAVSDGGDSPACEDDE